MAASSWTQLTLELSACEKQIGVIRLKADERVQQEKEKVAMVDKKRRDLVDAHEVRVKERLEEYEGQLGSITAMADQEIEALRVAKQAADARIELAERYAAKAAAQAKVLEKQVKQLYALSDQARAEHDRRLEEVRQASDIGVDQKLQEADGIIRGTSLYATEVQGGALAAMTEMQDGTRSKIAEQENESRRRSRYKELYEMARTRNSIEIAEPEFRSAKSALIQEWNNTWAKCASRSVEVPSTPGRPRTNGSSPTSTPTVCGVLEAAAERSVASPWPPATPRSKERALARAAEDQLKRGKQPFALGRTTGQEASARPRTAP